MKTDLKTNINIAKRMLEGEIQTTIFNMMQHQEILIAIFTKEQIVDSKFIPEEYEDVIDQLSKKIVFDFFKYYFSPVKLEQVLKEVIRSEGIDPSDYPQSIQTIFTYIYDDIIEKRETRRSMALKLLKAKSHLKYIREEGTRAFATEIYETKEHIKELEEEIKKGG